MMHVQQWFQIPNLFDEEQLAKVDEHLSDMILEKGGVVDDFKGKFQSLMSRNCKAGWLYADETNEWLFQKIIKAITDVNDRTFKFELDHVEPLQYLEYGFGQFYNKHVDNGADSVATRKITMVIQLSDPKDYVGGGLTIDSMARTRHAPRGRGSVAIFPSHLPHKANPVWIGKRKALVAWMRGKKPLS
jgi:PKHD-type hydroxylase